MSVQAYSKRAFSALLKLTAVNGWLPTRVSLATRHALADLLGKRDNDALRPADVGYPVRVLVLHFANELGPVGAHARNESVDVIDGEHDATDAQRVWRRVVRISAGHGWPVELR